MQRRLVCALLWAAGSVVYAQTSHGPDELLDKIKFRAQENLTRLPDYICQQTVERQQRDSNAGEYRRLDTIRLEVGLIGDQELFAWPDAARIDEEQLSNLVHHGIIGNGSFGLHARNVFLSKAPDFEHKGPELLDQRKTIRFDFTVPVERSNYRLRVGSLEALVGYEGSFWVAAGTLDLVRLRVNAVDVPRQLGVAEVGTTLDYSLVEIGGSSFLLPLGSSLVMATVDGIWSRNLTEFTACRRYVGESSISYGRGATDSHSEPETQQQFHLPPHVTMEMILQTEIDSTNAVIGDPVQAVLSSPVESDGEVLAPKGSLVRGRLVRMERHDHPVGYYVIGLELHTLEVGERVAPILATMRKAAGSSALMKEASSFTPTFDKRTKKAFMQVLVNECQRGQGILHWKADKPVVKRGLKMYWETEPNR